MKKVISVILLTISLSAEHNKTEQDVLKSLVNDVVSIFGEIKKSFENGKKSSLNDKNSSNVVNNTTPKSQINQQPKAKEINRTKTVEAISKDEKELLRKMGIIITDEKISIDANKTRAFLEKFRKTIETGIQKGIQKASKEMPKESDLGVKVEPEKVEIDLNRTKNFLKKWLNAVGTFIKELDKSVEPLTK